MKAHLHLPGDPIGPLPPGSFILTHGTNWISKLIRFGEHLHHGAGSNWNHAALAIGSHNVAEALGHGVVTSSIEKYRGTEFLLIWDDYPATDVAQMKAYAVSVLEEKAKYGYLEILCLGLTMLLRLGKRRLLFGMSGSMICSGFVSEALTRAGAIFPVPPGYMTPADLAVWATK